MNKIDDYWITTYSKREYTPESLLEDHIDSYEYRLRTYRSCNARLIPSLTILIPSCKKHREFTQILCRELDRQRLKYIVDSREDIDLGTKRQDLYRICNTKYSVQWDSDDWIAGNFAEVMSSYLRLYPGIDCINFLEHVVMGDKKTLTRRSINFPWNGMMLPGNEYAFSPNTKSIILTELARQVDFVNGNQGEDLVFGRDIRSLLKSEINIDFIGYFYEYHSEGTATGTNEHQVRK
jgi:hypothetical protein